MRNYDNLIRTIKNANEKVVAFLGAGISRLSPSFAPLVYQIKNSALESIANLHNLNSHFEDLVNGNNPTLCQKFEDMPLESFLQRTYNPIGESSLELFEVVGIGKPNLNHYVFCMLLDRGLIDCLITTNQDDYLETAYKELIQKRIVKRRLNLCIRPNSTYKIKSKESNIVKLHGSIDKSFSANDIRRWSTIQAALHQVGRGLETRKVRVLAETLRNSSIFFTGYKGVDIDIRTAFRGVKNIKQISWNFFDNKSKRQAEKDDSFLVYELKSRGIPVSSLIGDLNQLLRDVASDLQLPNIVCSKATVNYQAYEQIVKRWTKKHITRQAALEVLGRTYFYLDENEAFDILYKAYQVALKRKLFHRAAECLSEYGELKRIRGDFREASRAFNEVFSLAAKINRKTQKYSIKAASTWALAQMSLIKSEYDYALDKSFEVLRYSQILTKRKIYEGDHAKAIASRNIALIYREQGKLKKSIHYDQIAIENFQKWGIVEPLFWAWRSLTKSWMLYDITSTKLRDALAEMNHLRMLIDKFDLSYFELFWAEYYLVFDDLSQALSKAKEAFDYGVAVKDTNMQIRAKLIEGEATRRYRQFGEAKDAFICAQNIALDRIILKLFAKLGHLEAERLQKAKMTLSQDYSHLVREFSKLGIWWGHVRSLIGLSLNELATGSNLNYQKYIKVAASLAKENNKSEEYKLIKKITRTPIAREVNPLAFP